jgi:hypothetical protein
MKRLFLLLVLIAMGWYAYGKYPNYFKPRRAAEAAEVQPDSRAAPASRVEEPGSASFRCDGRTHCSQMTSCAEATYFLKNCPGTKMDGNHDGIPCEKQWCN